MAPPSPPEQLRIVHCVLVAGQRRILVWQQRSPASLALCLSELCCDGREQTRASNNLDLYGIRSRRREARSRLMFQQPDMQATPHASTGWTLS